MRTSARLRWGAYLWVLAAAAACSRDGEVDASEGPAGFVAMDDAGAPAAAPAPTNESAIAAPVAAPPIQAKVRAAGTEEVALAAALLHLGPADLKSWLARDGAAYSADRRNLALALSLSAQGSIAEAKQVAEDVDDDELSDGEQALLQAALAGPGRRAAQASYGADQPLALAMDMLLRERDARVALNANDAVGAARVFSSLMRDELAAPWEGDPATLARWNQPLSQAQRSHRWNARGKWPSIEVKVQKGDSLTLLRKRVIGEHKGLQICTGLIARANQLKDENALRPGDVLRVPTDRVSVVVDVSSRWMLYLHGDEVAAAFEIGVGRDGHDTPIGAYTVGPKQKDPMWFPKGGKPIPFGDPENPLGTRWIPWMLDGVKTDVGFHGTNAEAGVGGRVSQGCVRLRNVDAELLFDILPEGSEIRVQP
ncbi:MAG: L,D-transpeptidase family protein [Planctomycetes bacterium]|nr:L,D-transpeptidase family protein [Planctomycetota bacterium]